MRHHPTPKPSVNVITARVTAGAPRRRVRAAGWWMGLAVVTLALGCASRAPSEGAAPAPTSTGGEHPASSEAVFREEAPAAEHADGSSAEAEPSTAPADADAEVIVAADAFSTLRDVEAEYDALLDRGSADCPEAERLVQRICYLAERVCGLEGVGSPDPNDADGPARCDEARARCAASEARLGRACS